MKKTEVYEVIYGPHSILEAAKSGNRKIYKIYAQSTAAAFRRVMSSLPKKYLNVPVEKVSRDVIDRMANGQNHCGVAATVSPFKFEGKDFEADKNPRVLLLDGIQDVRNLGSILRSAHCSGFGAVVMITGGSAQLNASAISASAGLAQHLRIKQYSNVEMAISKLKNSGYTILSTVVSGGKDIRQVNISGPVCVVIGNEEKGISGQSKSGGILVTLPQHHKDASYNASVAAAIAMFWVSYASQ